MPEALVCAASGRNWIKCLAPDCLFFMCFDCEEVEKRGACCDDEEEE